MKLKRKILLGLLFTTHSAMAGDYCRANHTEWHCYDDKGNMKTEVYCAEGDDCNINVNSLCDPSPAGEWSNDGFMFWPSDPDHAPPCPGSGPPASSFVQEIPVPLAEEPITPDDDVDSGPINNGSVQGDNSYSATAVPYGNPITDGIAQSTTPIMLEDAEGAWHEFWPDGGK